MDIREEVEKKIKLLKNDLVIKNIGVARFLDNGDFWCFSLDKSFDKDCAARSKELLSGYRKTLERVIGGETNFLRVGKPSP